MEQQKKEMDTSKLRGMFEGAHIENCTQNFIWDNEVVNVYGKDEVKEINSADISDEKLRECINKILPLMKNSNRSVLLSRQLRLLSAESSSLTCAADCTARILPTSASFFVGT